MKIEREYQIFEDGEMVYSTARRPVAENRYWDMRDSGHDVTMDLVRRIGDIDGNDYHVQYVAIHTNETTAV